MTMISHVVLMVTVDFEHEGSDYVKRRDEVIAILENRGYSVGDVQYESIADEEEQ